MHWLLVGYMFLFIHRPFEVWTWMEPLHVERVYMLLTLAVWAVAAPKRWLPNGQHGAYAAMLAAVLTAWALSPWAASSQPFVEDWLKIFVFYALLVTTVWDEKGLKLVVTGFMVVMAGYLTHSFREYVAGRHVFRMGIARMIGVDESLGDPNSFGASIVFALPFVPALWRAGVGGRWGKLALGGYAGLSVLCVLLTGSRSSLLGLILWGALLILRDRRRWLWLGLLCGAAPLAFVALPESLQTRFETIVNPDVGPENAKTSGDGRIEGLYTGIALWERNPLTGIGPGAWRKATGSLIESHNLYGQLLGETGTFGLLAFLALLAGFRGNLRRVGMIRRAVPEWRDDLVFQVSGAVGTAVVLMLFMGNFGHNLFRFSWLWYGGFLIIARRCIDLRVRELADAPPADEAWAEDEEPAADLGDEWQIHPGHGGR